MSKSNLEIQPDPYLERLTTLEEEMREMRSGLARIEALLSGGAAVSPGRKDVSEFHVFFEPRDSERKPYLMRMDGIFRSNIKLSPIRAAIMSMFLLDLQDRYDDGRGLVDPIVAIQRAYSILVPGEETEKEIANNIRVALYRFETFVNNETGFQTEDFRLWFDEKAMRLRIIDQRTGKIAQGLTLQVGARDGKIVNLLSLLYKDSPIVRARKRRAIYVPAGDEGADRFLLQMYDHKFPLRRASLYMSPPLSSYPVSLLEHIGVSENVLERKRLVFDGYKRKQFHFTDVVHIDSIWNLIRYCPDSGFSQYPGKVTTEGVRDHLNHLIYLLESFENYNIYLSAVNPPFALGTYEIQSGVIPEYFTVFFQAFASAVKRDLGCFVLYGPMVSRNIRENIIDWMIAHSSTIRDKGEVIKTFKTVREHLEKKGPLPPL